MASGTRRGGLAGTTDPVTGRGPFDVGVERDLTVATRDGVRLATDRYHPIAGGAPVADARPVLLVRTPYDKRWAETSWAAYFASHGYIALVQDCRGTFASEGTLDLFVNEAHDGADTLAWIDRQPWSNGEVGTWGGSYAGYTQFAAATQSPTNLRAMTVRQSASHSWRTSVRHHGAFELRWMAWAFWHAAANTRTDLHVHDAAATVLSSEAASLERWLHRLPLRAGTSPLRLAPDYEQWLLRLMQSADEDDFWRQPSLAPVLHIDAIPPSAILLLGSWYDSYARSVVELYEAMRSREDLTVEMMMGPWTHNGLDRSVAGDIDLGPTAAINDPKSLHLRWFDTHLWPQRPGAIEQTVGTHEMAMADDPVRVFIMGGGSGGHTTTGRLDHGGQWRTLSSWPPQDATTSTRWLAGDGTLPGQPPADERSSTTYRFDPARPVPSIGGNVSSLMVMPGPPVGMASAIQAGGSGRAKNLVEPGGFDQVEDGRWLGCDAPFLPLSSRSDVLVFRTEELSEDLEILGAVRVHLWVSTSTVDTDVTAKLIDEYPPSRAHPLGYALNLSDSIVRLRYRDGSPAQLVEPDEIVQVTVELYPTGNRFVAGHRLRIDVSSSNFPRFDVNPNTGEPIGHERRRVAADVTIHHDRHHPSRVEIPVVATR
ncbi:MAG: CocE/NonD family hydrolase [Nitriliruptoraceae bacterium]